MDAAIRISADLGHRFVEGTREVWLLQGRCVVQHGSTTARANDSVLWIELGRGQQRLGQVTAYLEGDVRVDVAGPARPDRIESPHWLGTFNSNQPPELRISQLAAPPAQLPDVYRNALSRRDPFRAHAIRRTQYTEDVSQQPTTEPLPAGTRKLRAYNRNSIGPSIKSWPNQQANERITLITGGVVMVVDGVGEFGTIDISTDRLVVWTGGAGELDLFGQSFQSESTPLEFYMEGNIVFREGDRVIYASRMYYDVRQQIGIVLEADVLTPVPEYQGLLRLKAQVLQQTGPDRFVASDGFLTSSRMGRPGYRIAAGSIFYQDEQRQAFDPTTGQPQLDPQSGEPIIAHDRLASSFDNFLFIDEFPVFYWPQLATDLKQPQYYVKRVQFRNDSIFGTQILTDFDAYQLLGIERPPAGTEWDISLDYLSDRGPAAGTNFKYDRGDLFGVPGPMRGFLDAWGIHDDGLDNLGADRRALSPEDEFRYRVYGQHRQQVWNEYQLTVELGLISDRNFLEQYYEAEYDQLKDQTTGFELKWLRDNMSWSLSADARINDFFTQTQGVRLDHFWLGQSLWGDSFTWYEHSFAAYSDMNTAEPPADPADTFGLLPWEANVAGERLLTRQEIDLPFQAGPMKIVPYALGELAHWGEDRLGEPLDRAYGQVGVRASIPFWAANSFYESDLFNVHGIAHKVVVDADLSFADASRDLDELPLYDPLDDDAIEQFRRRLAFNTFGVAPDAVPVQFQERSYALRSGLASSVTSPVNEIADDMAALRMGVRQRWQTKRGPPGGRRIIDWVVLDTQAVWFPDENRDNFGEQLGLLEYDFRWHVGDRLTVLSDGIYDLFMSGQQLFSIGAFLTRPPRGSLYLGFQSMEGPFDSQVLAASYTYRMSPKWVSSFGTSVDISGNGNIGQNFSVTRIGESFLMSLGFNVDASKDNFGFNLAIEPRFLPSTRLGRAGGAQIPPAGVMGLE